MVSIIVHEFCPLNFILVCSRMQLLSIVGWYSHCRHTMKIFVWRARLKSPMAVDLGQKTFEIETEIVIEELEARSNRRLPSLPKGLLTFDG